MGDFKPRPVPQPLDPAKFEHIRKQFGLEQAQFDIVCRKICKGAREGDLQHFLYQCRKLNLDPALGQIIFVMRYKFNRDRDDFDEEPTIQVGIDGLRSLAEGEGGMCGQDAPIFTWQRGDEDGKTYEGKVFPEGVQVLACTITVYRYQEKLQKPVPYTYTAFLRDYAQKNSRGELTAMWLKVGIMLPKCSEAGALRKGWPQHLQGLYITEEMMQRDTEDPLAEPKKELGGAHDMVEAARGTLPDRNVESAHKKVDKVHEAQADAESRLPLQAEAPQPEQPAKELTSKGKGEAVVLALRDRYKDDAGKKVREFVARCAGVASYSDVSKENAGSMLGLLFLKLKESGAGEVIAMIEQKLSEKAEEKK